MAAAWNMVRSSRPSAQAAAAAWSMVRAATEAHEAEAWTAGQRGSVALPEVDRAPEVRSVPTGESTSRARALQVTLVRAAEGREGTRQRDRMAGLEAHG